MQIPVDTQHPPKTQQQIEIQEEEEPEPEPEAHELQAISKHT